MALTQAQFNIFLAGGDVDFNLPADPGPTSPDGIFFENVFFTTSTGDANSTAQGLTTLTALNDIANFELDDTSFIARNATVTVGDDFGTTFGTDSILSISGANAVLNMPGQAGNGNFFRMASEDGNITTATAYISNGATVTIDNPDANSGRGISVGVSFSAFQDGDDFIAGGQSVDATLVIEGAGTTVSILNTAGGNQGSIAIAAVFESDIADTTTNRSAEGRLIIRDGAELNVHEFIGVGNANNIAGATAEGALIVEGDGTVVNVGNTDRDGDGGFMRVAEEGGTGFFVLRDGAEFNMFRGEFNAGIQFSGATSREGGNATGLITGTDTRLFVEDGNIDVGRNIGTASLTISDGATVEARSLATAQAGTATTDVEGQNTRLILDNGTDGSLSVGAIDNQTNAIPSADGTMTISDGAQVQVRDFVNIGDTNGVAGATATGTLIVEGAGTSVTVGNADGVGRAGFMRVGNDGGTGTLTIRNGAEFELLMGSDGNAGIHFSGSDTGPGGTATATVTGADTKLVAGNGFIEVGRNVGTASLTVSDGALMETRDFSVAQGGTATAIIEGTGTRVVLSDGTSGSLDIGRVNFEDDTIPLADGTVTIRDGAEVEIRNFIGVGDALGRDGVTATGTLIVEGDGTIVTVGSQDRTGDNGFMRIGDEGGTGSFTLRSGAEFHLLAGDEFGGGLQLSGSSDAENTGGSGTALITGEGTRLVAEQDGITVGRNGGTATFTLSDGAIVDTLFFNTGRGGTGDTIIEGEGTQLNLSGAQVTPEFGAFMTVGRDANGTLTVREGADVTITGDGGNFPGFQAGRNEGGTGVITVTGAGSTITIDGADNVNVDGGETGFIRAGRDAGSDGTINVFDGGVITNDPDGGLVVAQLDGSTGKVTVDGAGSLLDFGAIAAFSEDAPLARGNAIVTVSNGGLLRGGEVINNGILDITSSGRLEADLTQDNILRSSSGIEDITIDGNLTVLTGGFDFDFNATGPELVHDTYTVTGDVSLEGRLFVLGTSLAALDGLDARLISGSSISVSESFSVQFIEFDAAAITEVDLPALIAASDVAVDLAFSTTGGDLVIDFGGNEIFGSNRADLIQGTSNSEEILASSGFDIVTADAGNDTVDGGGGNDTVDGGEGADDLLGGSGSDSLLGDDGDDTVDGGKGNDTVNGGADQDALSGSGGDDSLLGDTGDDTLSGGTGSDTLDGGTGADSINGDTGIDILIGGAGDDTLIGNGGNDSLVGDGGEDHLLGGNNNDTLEGGNNADTLEGGDQRDSLDGGAGADNLLGGRGVDTLNGGTGADTLNGQRGDDELTGGAGADVFRFRTNAGDDEITDFGTGADTLELDDALWTGTLTAAEVIDMFGDVTDTGFEFDFDGGESVTLLGVFDETGLEGMIDIV
ncbi:MAG: hypothetical protein AAGF33_00245 [Pseudomonadota bacterium]